MKIKYLLITLLLISCGEARKETTIEEIKDPAKNGVIEEDAVEVEGYIVGDYIPILVTDVKYYERNSVIPEEEYMRLDDSLASYINKNKQKFFGRKIKIKGKLEKSNANFKFTNATESAKITISADPDDITITSDSGLRPAKINDINSNQRQLKRNDLQQPNTNFALLYSGGANPYNAHKRYFNDIEYMYSVLTLKYGYTDENIVVVYKDGKPESPSRLHVDFAANTAGLNGAIAYLNNKMGQNRNLFLFLTNHGGGFSKSENTLAGGIIDTSSDEVDRGDAYKVDETIYYFLDGNNIISDDTFAAKINSLQLNSLIAVLEPCFGGGFVADLKGRNRVIMSAANEYEYSWSYSQNPSFNEFCYLFTSALKGGYHTGTTPLNADRNADGIVSVYEAFIFAKTNDKADEHPMIDDNGDGVSDNRDGTYASGLSLKSPQGFNIN